MLQPEVWMDVPFSKSRQAEKVFKMKVSPDTGKKDHEYRFTARIQPSSLINLYEASEDAKPVYHAQLRVKPPRYLQYDRILCSMEFNRIPATDIPLEFRKQLMWKHTDLPNFFKEARKHIPRVRSDVEEVLEAILVDSFYRSLGM